MGLKAKIHPSAVVDPQAQLGSDVEIGPYCVVNGAVTLDDDVKLLSHVAISGNTFIGKRTRVFPFASLGFEPQDLKFKGEKTKLIMGTDCTIREGVSINVGTAAAGTTKVGDHCTLLAQSHIAHDCVVGDHVILVGAVLAGHCKVGDYACLGARTFVHQFSRVGKHAFTSASSGVYNDIIPYGMAYGTRAQLVGLNQTGMRRHGIDLASRSALNRLVNEIFANKNLPNNEQLDVLGAQLADTPLCMDIIDFLKASDKRRIMRLERNGGNVN